MCCFETIFKLNYSYSSRVFFVRQVMESQIIEVKPSKTEYTQGEKWRIVKNILMLGMAFMIHFTAFHGASNLQSSINADEALGTSTLASVYGSLILSNIFLPAVVIRWEDSYKLFILYSGLNLMVYQVFCFSCQNKKRWYEKNLQD